MRSVISIFLLLFTTLLYSQTSSHSNKKLKIDSLLNESHQRGFFNGNVLVAIDGQIIYQNEIGYARADKSQPLNREHIFKIGSIAKEFDGVAIMLLNEKKKLSLDNTVSDYFPALPGWSKKVTIKDLLQYTSGLPSFNNQKIRTDEQVWNHLKNLDSLEFEPGTGYKYNNLNTFLRKRIVEKVSGQSFSEFTQENLLDAAGIKNSIIDPENSAPGMAQAFDVEFVPDNYPPYMSGWVALDIQDMSKWIESLHSGEILRQESLIKLLDSYKNNQSTLGSSDFQNGNLHYHYHHGQSGNFEASSYYNAKEKFTVIFLTNQKGNNVGGLTNAVDAILRGEKFSIPKKSIELSLRSKIHHHGYEAGMEFYNHIRKNEFDIYDFKNEEKELLETAEYLAQNEYTSEAIKLLNFISDKFPDSDKATAQLKELL
ncbi:beta-lactamase family protein [Gramella jeungdoensis]|uniref:Beta-lactamase family protein n=1 Tax=Gramella jeungdoensis TaxID=708091 RepID=A0ABT0Z4G2_9FLAO|nr:serine hydrolase domain-containing protein [Gramella jeungdoensis]MCM8570607.1 beta-lactamase family protein [Gramella jeungdoensis]